MRPALVPGPARAILEMGRGRRGETEQKARGATNRQESGKNCKELEENGKFLLPLSIAYKN